MSRVVTPWPGGGFYEGSLDEFLARVPAFFDSVLKYVTKWNRIFQPFALDIWSENTGENFDPEWEHDLNRIFTDKEFHDRIFVENDYSAIECPSLKEFFEESQSLLLHRDTAPREAIDVSRWPSLQGMSTFDKSQEVIYLTHAIDVLLSFCFDRNESILHGGEAHAQMSDVLQHATPITEKSKLDRENIAFIDVGAGKGYFSIFMCSEMRVKTLTIEASLSHASHLRNRIGCLASQKKVDPKSFDLMSMCIGYMTTHTNVEAIHTNAVSYDKWLKIVDTMDAKKGIRHKGRRMVSKEENTEVDVGAFMFAEQGRKPRVIQGELAVEIEAVPEFDLSPNEYITIGLHACGDLSIVTHEIALNSSHSRGAISVPCCYQHLSPARLPLLPENQQICDILFKDNDVQRHNLLNYALYEYGVGYETHCQSCKQFTTRAILECFIPPRVTCKKMPRQPDEALPDYVMRVSEHFDRHPTREEIDAKVRECESSIWKMRAHTLIREQFGHVFESFLLMERLTYFVKLVKEKPDKYLVGMYDVFSHLSPRGFSLFTVRL